MMPARLPISAVWLLFPQAMLQLQLSGSASTHRALSPPSQSSGRVIRRVSMGFFFRKSKSRGPFRLNLPKRGLGLSFGIKGARIGIARCHDVRRQRRTLLAKALESLQGFAYSSTSSARSDFASRFYPVALTSIRLHLEYRLACDLCTYWSFGCRRSDRVGAEKLIFMDSVLTCPQCQYPHSETIPVDRFVFFYECRNCHATLKPTFRLRQHLRSSRHHDDHHLDGDDGFAIKRNVPEAVFAFPFRAFFFIAQIPELATLAMEEVFQAKIHYRFQDNGSAEPGKGSEVLCRYFFALRILFAHRAQPLPAPTANRPILSRRIGSDEAFRHIDHGLPFLRRFAVAVLHRTSSNNTSLA